MSLGGLLAHAVGGGQSEKLEVPQQESRQKSPLPKTKENLIAGAAVYQENCSGCHGATGTPVRKFSNLERQPATLTQGTLQRFSDGDLNWILLHGAPGGMPSFAEDFSDTKRWQCIQFLRHLGKDAAKYSALAEAAGPAHAAVPQQKGSR